MYLHEYYPKLQPGLSQTLTSDIFHIISFALIVTSFCLHCFADKSSEYQDFKGNLETKAFNGAELCLSSISHGDSK